MKMIITIDIDKDWIRREAESYKEFFTGYINQISGLKVLDVELIKEKAPKRRKWRGIPIPPENLSWDEPKAGELININDWEEEWIKKNTTEEKWLLY